MNRFDPARAAAALDALLEKFEAKTADDRVIRDSAQALFDAPSVSAKDKGFAAYIVSNVYARLDDKTSSCRWAHAAVAKVRDEAYTVLEQAMCAP